MDDPYALAITFDDGYLNVYEYAFPILEELNAKATVFIITSAIGKSNDWDANLGWIHFDHLGEEEIAILSNSGWEIGSHGNTHKSLKTLSQDELDWEIGESKNILENRLNINISWFASPFGKVDRKILNTTSKYNYKGCCGFYPFRLLTSRNLAFEIPRLSVYMIDTVKTVENKISGDYKKLRNEVLKQNVISFFANATIAVNAVR